MSQYYRDYHVLEVWCFRKNLSGNDCRTSEKVTKKTKQECIEALKKKGWVIKANECICKRHAKQE